MQKRKMYLVCALASLLTMPAFAQSAHDAISGPDADFSNNTSKFEIASPDNNYKLGIAGHLQHDNQFVYTTEGEKKEFNTYVSRARLKFYGSAFAPSITYSLQLGLDKEGDLVASERQLEVRGSRLLRDYYVNFAFHPEYFQLRVGKFRTPFSRQQLISSSQMQFDDQDLANNIFQLTPDGHDIGVMFHNGFNHRIEWALAAVSNGIVGRVGYNHGGIDGYDFSDFAGGGLRFGIAANGFVKTKYLDTNFKEDLRAGVDGIVKFHGLSSNAAFYYRRAKEQNELGAGIDAGYLIHRKWEPLVRYSWAKLEDGAQHQIRGGLNHYFFGHHLKITGYVGPDMKAGKIARWEGGAQFQFAL